MSDFQSKTAVVLIIFNRPDTTTRVFEVIRQVKPPKLFVIADGSRTNKPDEAEKCAAARAVIEQVDWKCEVIKNYSDVNLGCAKRVSSGLNWVFEYVSEAIILEDDCVPEITFFRFCEELLERYRYDKRIVVISGQNVQFGRSRTEYSYYFSRYNHCWGWATWKRAWQYFDFDMKLWPEIRDGNFLKYILEDNRAVKNWMKVFQSTYDGLIDSWAYRWTFACWVQNGLSILPNVNLVSNIGFGENSTHTKSDSFYNNIPTKALDFPLKHQFFVIRHAPADQFTQNTLYNWSLSKRVITKLKLFLKNLMNHI